MEENITKSDIDAAAARYPTYDKKASLVAYGRDEGWFNLF